MRFFLEGLSLLLFFIITGLYQKKKKFFTTGYLYYVINIQIILNISPYYYTPLELKTSFLSDRIQFNTDYFYLYWKIYIFISIIIIIYLTFCKNLESINNIEFKFSPNFKSKISLLLFFIVIPLSFVSDERKALKSTILITLLNILYLNFFYDKNRIQNKLYYIINIVIFALLIRPYIKMRYIILTIFFPLILTKIFLVTKEKKFKKLFMYFLLGIISILGYGIISEIVKLNSHYNQDLNIINILKNSDSILFFAKKQIYRIFGVWIHLSGHGINYTKEKEMLYGITYIKNLSTIFNFDYINVAYLIANRSGANYAHGGIIVEGVMNFGVIGGIIAGLCPFFIAEYYFKKFYKSKNMKYFCLLTVPFGKVLLDGGSINSLIYNSIFCYLTFFLLKKFRLFFRKN